ncbi:MAG TPA: SusC/RagA family TonB-linked outer membrane protein [Chryseolinea sp.]|nr:SusC/RagA family TonB-linked outer membrane protein [Chryseolinea sp.]
MIDRYFYREQHGLCRLIRSVVIQSAAILMVSGVALGHNIFAQELLDRKVTLSLKDVTLERALAEIERAANVEFVYSRSRLKLNESVTLEAADKKLADLLTELLTPRGISFTAQEGKGQILLFLNGEQPPKEGSEDLQSSGQQRDNELRAAVSGTVTDAATSETLPGVNVLIKGTVNGTTTSSEGTYTLQANDTDVLVFSFIGYKPVEVKVGAHIRIDVALDSDQKTLDAVVINAGYYDVKDKEKTGSISKVTSNVIEKQPITNPLGALAGRMPGVFIQQNSGIPGGDFSIEIRGRNSLRTDGNAPLYVVDGVPFSSESVSAREAAQAFPGGSGVSPLTSLNPSDIESIEVLKDADATAIYGSRGANGVVLITTKKGKAGKTKFDVNAYTGWGRTSLLDVLNTQQYLDMRREAFANDGLIPSANPDDDGSGGRDFRSYAVDLMVWDTTRYADLQKVLIGNTAQTTSIQSSLSGGSESTQFLLSAGYRKETSVFPGDFAYQKGSAHLSVNHRAADNKFFINASVSGTIDRNNQVNIDYTNIARYTAPTAPALYDESGALNWENGTFTNPLAALGRNYEGRVSNLVGNVVIGYELLPGLQIKSSFGLNTMTSEEYNTVPSTTFPPSEGRTSATSYVITGNGNNRSWIIEPQASYERKIAKGRLSVLLGSTFQEQNFKRTASHYQNFPSNALLGNLSLASQVIPYSFVKSLYRYAAVFGRINYNWDGKYILNLTARRDGSGRFGPGRQFANFGAVGAAWIFSNESFIKNKVSFISFGKLRGSYGITGNDQIGDYQFLDTYSTGGTQYQGIKGISPTRLYNPDFAWETNRKLEGAVELGFLNDRLLMNVSWYRNRSSNQLVNYTLPMTTGSNGILANLPATVQNTGIEAELTTVNIERGSFTWTTSFNITVPRNKLIEFPNLESSSYASSYIVGKPIYIKMLYEATGVDPQTGLYTFRDFNDDGVITSEDDRRNAVFVGTDFYGGLNNSISYKGWSLDIFFQFVKQTGYNYRFQMSMPGISNNQSVLVLDGTRWQQPGDIADLQRFATESNSAASVASTRYHQSSDAIYSDASFIRLKNIALSYRLPERWTTGFTCRLYMQGQNLFVFTKYKGYDPESQITRIAPLRMLTGGIQFTL